MPKKQTKKLGISAFRTNVITIAPTPAPEPVVIEEKEIIKEQEQMNAINKVRTEKEVKQRKPRAPRVKTISLKSLIKGFDNEDDTLSFLQDNRENIKNLSKKDQKTFIDYIKNKFI